MGKLFPYEFLTLQDCLRGAPIARSTYPNRSFSRIGTLVVKVLGRKNCGIDRTVYSLIDGTIVRRIGFSLFFSFNCGGGM